MKQRLNALNVSIVIPAYNEERHLVACLDAIAVQTVPVLEAIVVDNNCTDRTVAIARRYSFVRVVREPHQGRVFARNTGFDAVKGEIIGRIDADTVLPSDWVAHIQSFYADPAHHRTVWTGSGFFHNVRFPRFVSAVYRGLVYGVNHIILGHYTVWGSNMALLQTQWHNVRTVTHRRTDIHEDLDLAIHLYQAGYTIVFDKHHPVPAVLKRIHSNRHELWSYLQWWPRTLQVHGRKTWVVAWFFGFLLYVFTPVQLLAEQIARLFGKRPIDE